MNHDRMKLCRDTNIPKWIQRDKKDLEKSGMLSDHTDIGKFCICREPDTGTFMIQCDECREWFHGSCVGVTEVMAKGMDIYECPQCTTLIVLIATYHVLFTGAIWTLLPPSSYEH